MGRKLPLIKTATIYVVLAMLLSGALPAVAPVAPVVAQEAPMPGDITGDGVVDGRDALRIMRVVEGCETATPEEVARGDVYPLPGTAGRLIGDGRLTREDAEKILRSSVGLIPEGEITGDYSASWPMVERFEPLRGPAGTQITVYGENFIAGSPGENIVYIGETLAPVQNSSGTQLLVTVPERASTGRVRVITPAGEGRSALDFHVMMEHAGRLVPPAGLNPSDFTVANSVGDQAHPDAGGAFTIPTDSYGVTMQMALPNAEGDERMLMNMDVLSGQALAAQATTDDPAVMDLLTTAQGMVFLSPYLTTDDVAFAEATMAVIADDPQVQALAALLAQLYQETEEPLDDPRFDEAYFRAVESVLNRLPAGMVIDLGSPEGQSGSGESVVSPPQSVLDLLGARDAGDAQFFHLASQSPDATSSSSWRWQAWYPENDFTYTEAQAGLQPGQIVPSVPKGNPVDWIVQLAEVDDIYSVFPEGKQSLARLDPRQVLPRDAYHSLSGARADSGLKYIDLWGLTFNAGWDALGEAVTTAAPGLEGLLTPTLQVDPDKDAVYVVRAYSGMLNSGADPGEFDFVYDSLPNGRTTYLVALGQNAAWAAVDMISVAINFHSFVDKSVLERAIRKGIERAIARSPRALSPAVGVSLFLEVANQVVKDVLSAAAASAVGEGITKATLKIIGKSLNPLTLLYRVSTGAQGVERLASLVGYNWRMSPLETWIIVVGDPYTPRLEQVTPENPAPGDEIMLRGHNFDYRSVANNEVRIGDWWPSATPADIISVSQDGAELRFKLPDDAPPGQGSVWIKVPYRATPFKFENVLDVRRRPQLTGMTPAEGYGPSTDDSGPYANFDGTSIILSGRNLRPGEGENPGQPDEAHFGDTVVEAFYWTDTAIQVKAPQLPPGPVRVYIRSPHNGTESQHLTFTVLDKPQLTSVTPASAKPGHVLTLQGGHFKEGLTTVMVSGAGGSGVAPILDLQSDTLAVQMPTVGEPGDSLNVQVWNPAGPSTSLAVVREAGLEAPEPVTPPEEKDFPPGYSLLVNEADSGHQLSFDDANAFINGTDPFAPPYDDLDAVYEWVWQENAQCLYEAEPESKRGPFYSYHKGQYNYDFDGQRGHPGSEQEIIMRINVLRPECHGGQGGESDPVLLINGLQDAPETGWDEEVKCDERYVADDCPEEGDFVGYRSGSDGNGGQGYADLIEFDPGVESYHGGGFEPGDGDTLTGLGDLILSGSITIQNANQVSASGIERVAGIAIVGDGKERGALNHISAETVGSGGIRLTNAVANQIEVKEIRNATVGVDIEQGGGNSVTVRESISNMSGDGVHIISSVGSGVGSGWIESPGGYGVYIEGGGRNSYGGGVRSSGSTAVYLKETVDSWAGAEVESAGGRGFEIVGGGLNSVGGSVDGAKGDGVRVTNSSKNEVGVTVSNCSGYGVALLDVWDHTISGGATGCTNSGLYIQGGGNHEVTRFNAETNGSHGIELNNTVLNTLGAITSAGNQGNGLHLSNGASFTAFTAFRGGENEGIWNNQNGIVIEGPTTYHNAVGNAGVRFRFYEDDEYIGNRQNGIVIQNGAHDNAVYGAYGNNQNGVVIRGGAHDNIIRAGIIGNRQHGVLIEDAHDNTITKWNISGAFSTVSGNGTDGIRIDSNATDNMVEGDLFIYGNGGNGITVLGAGTQIRGEWGMQVGQTSQYTPLSNRGFGIFVDGGANTRIVHVEAGRNEGGGIRVQNVNRPVAAAGAEPLITIGGVRVGYEKIYPDQGLPTYRGIDGLRGYGVYFEDCTDVLYAVRVYSHQVGLHIGGEDPARFDLNSGSVISSTGDGIELLNLQDSDINLYASNNGGNGISLVNGRDVRFIGNEPTSVGYDLAGVQNGGSGISIEDSEDITIGYAGFSNNQQHGVYIGPQSRHIDLPGVRASDNQGSGVYIKQASDVELSPAGSESARFAGNEEAGIKIEDAESVQLIAFADEANDIGADNGIGIEVRGQDGDDIVISGWDIRENREAGIRVEDATNVMIGGFSSDEGNVIRSNKNGIIATGSMAQVIIANNRIRDQVGMLPGRVDGPRPYSNHRMNPAEATADLAGVGVALYDAISGATIVSNTVESNAAQGVWLGGADKTLLLRNSVHENAEGIVIEGVSLDDAVANQVSSNVIQSNEGPGVVVAGESARGNTITRNTITQNDGEGISLESGGNQGIEAPVITRLSHRGSNIEGTANAADGSIVGVFADLSDEGALFLGQTAVWGGHFHLTTQVPPGMELHATVTDPGGNTSEFGPADLYGPPMADYVFTSTRDGNEEIYLMGSGLSSARRLTARPAADNSPRLCVNSNEVVFASNALGSWDIWWVNSDGTGLEQLTQHPGDEFDPACSPSGDQFAYSDGQDLFAAGLGEGNGSTQELAYDDGVAEFAYGAPPGHAYGVHFTRPPAAQGVNATPKPLVAIRFWIDADPAEFQWQVYDWVNGQPGPLIAEGQATPEIRGWHTVELTGVEVSEDFLVGMRYNRDDQPKLGFDFRQQASDRSWLDTGEGWWRLPSPEFIMIRADFAPDTVQLTDDAFADRQPDWCADGSRIAFTSNRGGNDDVWVIDSDGANLRQVTANPAADHSPAWSPDCSQIAFVSERDGNPEIYRIDPGGTTLIRLTDHAAADTDPAWLPDGLKLLFVSDRDAGQEIYAMDANGGALERLTNSLGDNTQPDAGASSVRTRALSLATASINSAGPTQLAIPPVNVQPGETFTVPITLAGAQNLGHLAFELTYPAGNLTLLRILPGLMLKSDLYAINPESTVIQSGRIRFGWVQAGGVHGGGELLQLVFRAEPVAYGTWPLVFANPGAFDVTLTVLEVNAEDGQVDVPWPPTPTPTVTPTPTMAPTPTITPTPGVRKMWLPLVNQS